MKTCQNSKGTKLAVTPKLQNGTWTLIAPDGRKFEAESPLKCVSKERVGATVGRRVLDPCCGSRMMWLDRKNPDVVFGDRRSETIIVTDRSHGNTSGIRTLRIEPDMLIDFRALPYPDGSFKLVAFDPPHLVRAGPRSWLAAKYGKLSKNWRDDLRAGFAECFRVLGADGVLVFKWNETQVKVSEVLALTPVQPLFGHLSGRKGLTHWLVFMSPNADLTGRSEPCLPTWRLWQEAVNRTAFVYSDGHAIKNGQEVIDYLLAEVSVLFEQSNISG